MESNQAPASLHSTTSNTYSQDPLHHVLSRKRRPPAGVTWRGTQARLSCSRGPYQLGEVGQAIFIVSLVSSPVPWTSDPCPKSLPGPS